MWLNKLIIFLIRRKFGLKKFEAFRFANQGEFNTDIYFFNDTKLRKRVLLNSARIIPHTRFYDSSVSLNFLFSDKCKIVKLDRPPIKEIDTNYDFIRH